MAALRAGLVGLGAMGRNHARVMRGLAGFDLVGVADPAGDPNGIAGGAQLVDTVDELIGLGIDVAVVAAPTVMHEGAALALASAGIHTMVEKPVAADSEAGQRMVDAFGSAGLVGAVGHIERFNPALQEMRRRIAAGELGEVYQVATRRQGPFPVRIADVGVVKDLGTHDLDLTAWVAQSPHVSVAAQVAHRSGRAHEDMVVVAGRLANGVITSHVVNWLSPMKERVTIVTGERGAFIADTVNAVLSFHANGTAMTEWESIQTFRGVSEGDTITYALTKREPLVVEHETFRDAVLGTRLDVVSLEEGLRTLRAAEAVLESARTGRTVQISE